MSFRSTVVRLAEHARTPLIRFPDRKASHAHPATAHPCAPQSVIDSFSRFQDAQQQDPQLVNSSNSSYGGSPTPGGNPARAGEGKGSSAASSGSGAGASAGAGAGAKGGAVDELPAWLRRTRPEEDEIEAVMSGGASTTPEITRAFKQRWYTPQF